MRAMPFAALFDVLTSKKSALLLAPGLLLFGATLAVGQNPGLPNERGNEATTAAPGAAATPATKLSTISAAQRKEIETIIKEFLINNPEVLLEAQNVL
jgi:hypothetical protein